MRGLTVAALVAQGLTVGTFFAFSTFVMAALDRLGPLEAARAMRSINATILGSPFMAVFVLSTVLAVALPLAGGWGSPLLVASGAAYLIGTFGVTLLGDVPLNDALARASATDAGAWRAYAGAWTLWNHVRTLAGIASVVGVAWSLREGG